ncbi:MAG: ABC transporter permease [Planctomycetaceae bacterium]|nr:MAG: ABC transporter permease [Planctomycetaceae bacterium]
MATADNTADRPLLIRQLGAVALSAIRESGEMSLFAFDMLIWLVTRRWRRSVLVACLYQIGVESIPVVLTTGAFIGMVMAVQSYDQLRYMHLETNLGAVINISLVKELGPVLAATMLAGRVGCAMAAELGTMKITEQIDALRVLGANPMQYLVVPRFIACVTMVPILTVLADAAGVTGGWFFSTQVCGVDSHHYWQHTEDYINWFDLLGGIVKSVFFGGATALVACQRGFACRAGAEGVGQAATQAFVYGFVAILAIDFFLGILLNAMYPLVGLMSTGLN